MHLKQGRSHQTLMKQSILASQCIQPASSGLHLFQFSLEQTTTTRLVKLYNFALKYKSKENNDDVMLFEGPDLERGDVCNCQRHCCSLSPVWPQDVPHYAAS